MSTLEDCSSSKPCGFCALQQPPNSPIRPAHPSSRTRRRRPAPMSLPQIEVQDRDDLVAVKRAKNTMAARKSRQKAIDYVKNLERQFLELTAERNHWQNWAMLLEEEFECEIPYWTESEDTSGQEITSNPS